MTIEKIKQKFTQKRLDKAKVLCYNIRVNEIWCHGQAVRQRSATPLSPVRFRVAPPTKSSENRKIFTAFLYFLTVFNIF